MPPAPGAPLILGPVVLKLVVEGLKKLADGEIVEEGIVVGGSIEESITLKGLLVLDGVLEGEIAVLGGCAASILTVLL
jgi:hypothetical protein